MQYHMSTVYSDMDFQRFSLETERNGNQLVISGAGESDAGVGRKSNCC